MENKRESTTANSVSSLWKRLWTCRKTDYRINEFRENKKQIGSPLRCIYLGSEVHISHWQLLREYFGIQTRNSSDCSIDKSDVLGGKRYVGSNHYFTVPIYAQFIRFKTIKISH